MNILNIINKSEISMTAEIEILPLYYFTFDLAKLIGVSHPTIKRWDDNGDIPKSLRIGTKRVWLRKDMDSYLKINLVPNLKS